MTVKRIISFILSLALLSCALVSCAGGGDGSDSPFGFNFGNKKEENDTASSGEIYEKYPNLCDIGAFVNGLAAFRISDGGGSYHWSVDGAWNGNYYYGYTDIKGNIVIEPTYECSPHKTLPAFGEKYVKTSDLDHSETIIDRDGKIIYQTGKDGVTAIGNVSEGYFWVETVKEQLSGNVYTVTYYSAKDLSKVVSYEDARAITDYMNSSIGYNSTLNEYGTGAVIKGDDAYSFQYSDVIYVNISEYDRAYKSSAVAWGEEIPSISEFKDASACYYHVSSTDNKGGSIASVVLISSSRVRFFATVNSSGKVLMQPQQNVTFPISDEDEISKFEFRKDLCPALDAESGLWGYIDPNGNWKIRPEYTSATSFSADGYATVNSKIVINTEGKIRLAPEGWANEVVTSLSGKYKYAGESYTSYYIEFTEDGKVTISDVSSAGTISRSGTYILKGANIEFIDLGTMVLFPAISGSGTYAFSKEGNTITLNGTDWTLVGEK